jgi:hypothetical protein
MVGGVQVKAKLIKENICTVWVYYDKNYIKRHIDKHHVEIK